MELEKNQRHTVTIEGYGSDGAGVCHIEGRAVFVPRAMRGETWEIKLLRVTRGAVFARGERLLTPSPERIEPACPHFGLCGGCDLMHMSYAEEKTFKRERVRDAMRHIGGLDVPPPDVIAADSLTEYRNKGIYAVGKNRDGGASIGFYRQRSHDVTDVERCLIQSPLADAVAGAVRRWMRERNVPAYDEAAGRGLIRHIFTRRALKTGEAMAVIVSAAPPPGAKRLVDLLREAAPELTSIQLCIDPSRGNTVLAGEFTTLFGAEQITESLCGLEFRLSARSFFQINPPQAEKLYAEAVRMASGAGEGRVVDLYCGAGTISLCLASRGLDVLGVELVPEAVADARQNAERNGVSNVEFICADAGEAASGLLLRGERPSAVVVDPPRKGLAPEVIDAVCGMSPRRVVYVSCDPATLARDVRLFRERGWRLLEMRAVDMFPRCANVEAIAALAP